MYPITRMRRLRYNQALRGLVEETEVGVDDLVYPIFIDENIHEKKAIESMPGIYRLPLENVLDEVREVESLGIKAILLFGIPKHKDELGSASYDDNGIIQKAVKLIKKETKLLVIADLCLCEYTSHGHCGIVKDGYILNDETL